MEVNDFRIQRIMSASHQCSACEVSSCTLKSTLSQVLIVIDCGSPRCLVDDFTLSHICECSKVSRCLIVGNFSARHINWTEITSVGRGYSKNLLLTSIQCNIIQSIPKLTIFNLDHESLLLDLVLTHNSDNVKDLSSYSSLLKSTTLSCP